MCSPAGFQLEKLKSATASCFFVRVPLGSSSVALIRRVASLEENRDAQNDETISPR